MVALRHLVNPKDDRPFDARRRFATSLWAALIAVGCGGPVASEAPIRPSAVASASAQPSTTVVAVAPAPPLACPDGRATAEQAREVLRLGTWSDEGGLSIPREAFMRGIRGCIDEDAVIGWLGDPDAKERHIAAEILRKAGTRYVREASLAAQVVRAWSSDPAQGNRRVLAWAVQRIDLEATGTDESVRARLESAESYFDRGYLILGLMQEHPSSAAAFRLVYGRLQDKDGVVRAWAMEGLGDSKVHHEEICAAAVGWVAQADGGDRVQAAIKTFYRLDGCVDHFGALLDAVATHVRAKGPGHDVGDALGRLCAHPKADAELRARAATLAEQLARLPTIFDYEAAAARAIAKACRRGP